ncbi:DUF1926 domain-containing protein [bacterium]|nr:DUF1926 domain-containing protein [bacterium]
MGNFDTVIDSSCDKAYLPFLKMLAKYPRIKLGLHTSGCLWEWLEANRPEYGKLVAELCRRGQIELLGGGMYEPILPVLPRGDALWQLTRMNQFLGERFGAAPRGMWCPERVWEPHLPELIASAGLEYTLLDDYHFESSALPDQVKREYFITEHAGRQVALMPISKKLRYTLPFKPVQDTIEYLRELAEDTAQPPLVVFGDDGEKFGVWPDTHEWVYERGWLKDFFETLDGALDWLDIKLPSEVLDSRRPAGNVYVPCMSYTEMGEWSRVDPDATKDDPPGFWRNYFHKYPESNAMHRRMLGVSKMLNRARDMNVDESRLDSAATDLGRAQCNCAYWHGIFGGLYLNYLRQAISYHTLAAEQTLLDVCPQLAAEAVHTVDHDGLGWHQHVLRSNELTVILDPGRGLCLNRLDYRPTRYCWTDVLSRRREAYHKKVMTANQAAASGHESIHDRVLVKEDGLAERLVVDPHQRVGFTTYFCQQAAPDRFLKVPHSPSEDPNPLLPDYGIRVLDERVAPNQVSGVVRHDAFSLEKSIQLDNNRLVFSVKLAAGTVPAEDGEFFIEFNLTLLTDQAKDRYLRVGDTIHQPDQTGNWTGARAVLFYDGWQRRALSLSSDQLSRILYYPVYTVSSSEDGFERTYQGSCVMLGYSPQALVDGIAVQLTIKEQ